MQFSWIIKFSIIQNFKYGTIKLKVMPSLSIIIPIYNEEKLLEGVIERIVKYVGSLNIDYEILMCLNGCTDKSEEIANNLTNKNIKVFSTQNKGFGVALNWGIINATKEIITYLHSDGESDYTFIERALKLMEDYELITGSRYLERNVYWKDKIRSILSYGALTLTKVMIPLPITEVGPAKMFKKEWGLTLLKRNKEKGRRSWQKKERRIRANNRRNA